MPKVSLILLLLLLLLSKQYTISNSQACLAAVMPLCILALGEEALTCLTGERFAGIQLS